jgi:hypothetical protein
MEQNSRHSTHDSTIYILISNIVDIDNNRRRLERILKTMKLRATDIYSLGKKSILQCEITSFRFSEKKEITEYHIITSESDGHF